MCERGYVKYLRRNGGRQSERGKGQAELLATDVLSCHSYVKGLSHLDLLLRPATVIDLPIYFLRVIFRVRCGLACLQARIADPDSQ